MPITLFIRGYLCVLVFIILCLCFPLFPYFYLGSVPFSRDCLAQFSLHVYVFLPLHTRVYSCLRMITRVLLCLQMFNHTCRTIFTNDYSRLPLFTSDYLCLYLFT